MPAMPARRADGAVEPRCAEAVEETAVHAGTVEQPHGAGIAVGKDRFRAEFVGEMDVELVRDFVERFVPGDRAETAFTFWRRCAAEDGAGGGRVLAIEIARHFAAEKSARDRVRRVAAEFRAAAGLIDIDKERAGVRAIERANGMAVVVWLNCMPDFNVQAYRVRYTVRVIELNLLRPPCLHGLADWPFTNTKLLNE